jgi:hypothetical protein
MVWMEMVKVTSKKQINVQADPYETYVLFDTSPSVTN